MDLFDREEIQRLLELLADRLASAGISGTISLVGGAALSLQYLTDRDATTDIDAILPQDEIVGTIIQQIALEEDLVPTWVNDAVKAYVPFETNEMWIELFTVGAITIRIASAELLLAMKLKADRGMRDRGDIEGLIKLLEVKEVHKIEEIYERFHHQEVLSERTLAVVKQILINS